MRDPNSGPVPLPVAGRDRRSERIAELTEQKTQLIAYLNSKVRSGDWHAVQDAASDIREIDAKLEELNG